MDGAAMYYALMAANVVSVTTWNPADMGGSTSLSNGNLTATSTASANSIVRATNSRSSGKLYFEVRVDVTGAGMGIGVVVATSSLSSPLGSDAQSWGYFSSGALQNNASIAAFGASYTTGNIIGVCVDFSTGRLWFAKNNVWQGSGNPAAGTNPAASGLSGAHFPAVNPFTSTASVTARFIAAQQTYAPPSGFVAWG